MRLALPGLSYLVVEPLTVPVDEAPVVPVVDEPLVVVALPLDGVLVLEEDDGRLDEEPLDEPVPEVEPDTDEPEEPLDDGEVALLDEDGALDEDEGDTDPEVVPVEEPMPEAEPEAVPEALGPVELQAAKANAQANGTIDLIIFNSLLLLRGNSFYGNASLRKLSGRQSSAACRAPLVRINLTNGNKRSFSFL